MRKAAPIIAAERGMNANSRLKLRSLASDLRLPNDLYEAAILELNKAASDDQKLSTYERGYVKFLRAQFKKLKHGILSARMEKRALEIGTTKFQLDAERARQLIRREATQKGIGRISESDAEEHVEQLCADVIGKDRFVNKDQRNRMHAGGKQWGVDRDRVDAIVEQLIKQNRARPKTAQIPYVRSVSLLATLTIVAVICALILWNQRNRGGNANKNQSNSVSKIDPTAPQKLVQPDWWNGELFTKMTKLYRDSGGIRPIVDQLVSEDTSIRQNGYLELCDRIVLSENWGQADIEELRWFGRLFDREPSTTIANQLRDQTLGYLRLDSTELPTTDLTFRYGPQANRLAWVLFENCREGPRREAMEASLAQATGVFPGDDRTQYLDESGRSLERRNWQSLIDFGWSDPQRTITLLESLRSLPSKLADSERIQYQSEVLLFLLQSNDRQWTRISTTLAPVLRQCSNEQLRLWFELTKQTKNDSLATWLATRIAERMQVRLKTTRLPEMIATLRRLPAMQTEREKEVSSRWNRWRELYQQNLPPSESGSSASPENIAKSAYFATLALILGNATINENANGVSWELFDELVGEGIPRLDRTYSFFEKSQGSLFRSVDKPANAVDKRTRSTAIEKIRDYKRQRKSALATSIKSLGTVARRFPDVNPGDARHLASYFLSDLSDEEFLAVQQLTIQVRHWPNLLLAICDAIPESSASADQLIGITSLLTGSRIELSGGPSWRNEVRESVMRHISRSLNKTLKNKNDSVDTQWDRLEVYLAKLAALRGVAFGRTLKRESVPELEESLAWLVQAIGQSAGEPRSSARTNQFVRMVGANSLEQTILYNQLVIDLTAQKITLSRPDLLDPADLLLTAFYKKMNDSQQLAEQLRLTEITLMELWRLTDLERQP